MNHRHIENPNQTEIWTVLRLINWGSEYFKNKGISSPRLTMELMLAHLLKLSRFELYLKFDQPLTEAELAELRVCRGRGQHERECDGCLLHTFAFSGAAGSGEGTTTSKMATGRVFPFTTTSPSGRIS